MSKDVSDIKLADGKIVSIKGYSGDVKVLCLDFQSDPVELVFSEVIGLLAYSPEQVDLSHITSSTESPIISEALKASEEDSCDHVCYDFISAWSGLPILRIIARSVGYIYHND